MEESQATHKYQPRIADCQPEPRAASRGPRWSRKEGLAAGRPSPQRGPCRRRVRGCKSSAASVPRVVLYSWVPVGENITLEQSPGRELPGEPTHCNRTWLSWAARCQESKGVAADSARAGEGVAGGGACPRHPGRAASRLSALSRQATVQLSGERGVSSRLLSCF